MTHALSSRLLALIKNTNWEQRTWVDLVQLWRVGFYLTAVKQELEAVIVFAPRYIQYIAH